MLSIYSSLCVAILQYLIFTVFNFSHLFLKNIYSIQQYKKNWNEKSTIKENAIIIVLYYCI